MILNCLSDVVLARVLSFLSLEDLERIRLVSPKLEKLAKVEITKQLTDWRFNYIQHVKYKKEISPFLVRRLFEKAKSKKSTFSQRTTQLNHSLFGSLHKITEVSLVCYPGKFKPISRTYPCTRRWITGGVLLKSNSDLASQGYLCRVRATWTSQSLMSQ